MRKSQVRQEELVALKRLYEVHMTGTRGEGMRRGAGRLGRCGQGTRRGWRPRTGFRVSPKTQWGGQSQASFKGKNSSHLPKFPFQFSIALGCLTRV